MLALTICAFALAASQPPADKPLPPSDPGVIWPSTSAAISSADIDAALATGVQRLLAMQEGDPNRTTGADADADASPPRREPAKGDPVKRDPAQPAVATPPPSEWPYEGVYRVRGQIPIGYRVGGTAICGLALIDAPGYDDDAPRQAAVRRAIQFVCAGIDHPLMSVKDYDAGYDVRGWGYTYGALFLLELQRERRLPPDLAPDADKALAFYLDALEQTQIPSVGGWNYARPQGRETEASPSSFMTAATVQTLLAAKAAGREVNAPTLERALAFLEKTRYASGAVAYAGTVPEGRQPRGTSDAVPGAVGRMCIVEATLLMAGRGSVRDVRGALDAFFTHWQWLYQRSQKTGTHIPPYMVAPYYFMFAHRYAAQCVELLPPSERDEYRRRFRLLLWQSRQPDGTWNDRVFPRSGAYGTAMAMLALMESAKK